MVVARFARGRLRPESVSRIVKSPACGAVVTFAGFVRGSERGSPISAIVYEAYEAMALPRMRKLAVEARRRWNVRSALVHRLGRVPVGEAAVVVACAGVHRREAFQACRWLIDRVKADAPIWKARHEPAARSHSAGGVPGDRQGARAGPWGPRPAAGRTPPSHGCRAPAGSLGRS